MREGSGVSLRLAFVASCELPVGRCMRSDSGFLKEHQGHQQTDPASSEPLSCSCLGFCAPLIHWHTGAGVAGVMLEGPGRRRSPPPLSTTWVTLFQSHSLSAYCSGTNSNFHGAGLGPTHLTRSMRRAKNRLSTGSTGRPMIRTAPHPTTPPPPTGPLPHHVCGHSSIYTHPLPHITQ